MGQPLGARAQRLIDSGPPPLISNLHGKDLCQQHGGAGFCNGLARSAVAECSCFILNLCSTKLERHEDNAMQFGN